MTDQLIQVSQEAVFKLEQEPSTTVDFVTLLTFLDEIQEQMEQIEDDSSIVRDLYELVEKHQVPVCPEDLAMYQVLSSIVRATCVLHCVFTHMLHITLNKDSKRDLINQYLHLPYCLVQ